MFLKATVAKKIWMNWMRFHPTELGEEVPWCHSKQMRRTIALPVLVIDIGRCVCAACSHVSRLSTSETLWDTLGSSNMIWCWFIAPSTHPMISICVFSMSLAHQSTPSWPCHAKDPHWACPQVTRNVGLTWPYMALPRLLGFPSNDRMEGRPPRDSQCFWSHP